MRIYNVLLPISMCLAQYATAEIIQCSVHGKDYGATQEAQQLWQAAANNDLQTVKHIVTDKNVNSYNQEIERFNGLWIQEGYKPLHFAAYWNNRDMAYFLIKNIMQVDARDGTQQTPLHIAAMYNNLEVAELLIERGAQVDARGVCDKTPLHIAAMFSGRDVAELLTVSGARPDVQDALGYVPGDMAHPELEALFAEIVPWLTQETVTMSTLRDVSEAEKVVYAKMAFGKGCYENGWKIIHALKRNTSRADIALHVMMLEMGQIHKSASTAELSGLRGGLLADARIYAAIPHEVVGRMRSNRISASLFQELCYCAKGAIAKYRDEHGNTLLHEMAHVGMASDCVQALVAAIADYILVTSHTYLTSSLMTDGLKNASGLTPRDIALKHINTDSRYRRFVQAYDDAIAGYVRQRSMYDTFKRDQGQQDTREENVSKKLADIDIFVHNSETQQQ